MPINQANKDKPVLCIACGKMICKGHIESGSIEISCKCGVKNRIEAEIKPEGRKPRKFVMIPEDIGTIRTATR